jgi:molybdate/tungstate transport system ATP-binding protein
MIGVEGLEIRAGAFALSGVSFGVPAGAYAVLMGRTGGGKTSLLEALAGLRAPAAGRILLAGRDVTALPPAERGIGYVPQDRALFRTMSVRDNLAFGPRVRGWAEPEIRARVGELAELLDVAPLLDRSTRKLSGGEAQRVALGRAIASRPSVLLLDEPLSALDDATWEGLVRLLGTLKGKMGLTALHVTHRAEEARRLADRLFVLEDGVLKEGRTG